MRALLTAIACSPDWGSEGKVGWDAVRTVATFADCHVITQPDCREGIERIIAETGIRLTVHYFGKHHVCHANRMAARLRSWQVFVEWQKGVNSLAAELNKRYSFDVIHQVTYATWRVPSLLWQLPQPFVWGPLGGGGDLPFSFYRELSRSGQCFEALRRVTGLFCALNPQFKACLNHSAAVLAADKATAVFLGRHSNNKSLQILSPCFFDAHQANSLRSLAFQRRVTNGNLKLFSGGNLEGRKGVALALQAIARLQSKGIHINYTLGGSGPERRHLEELAKQLGISSCVLFSDVFRGDAYRQRLAESDVYLLPSLRETAGITMMEAVLAGCYPIVLKGTGAGDIIDRIGGSAISADYPEEAIRKITEILEWCHRQRTDMRHQAEDAGRNLSTLYSEDAYRQAIHNIYLRVIDKPRRFR